MEKITGIYCIENLINGKKYIGQSVDIYRRWNGYRRSYKRNDKYAIYRAIKKHGFENFRFYIIKECTQDKLNDWERFYIKFFGSNNSKFGYNITKGGDYGNRGIKMSEKAKKLLSDQRKGVKLKPEHVEKIREGTRGRKHSNAISKYRGVFYDKRRNQFVARIWSGGHMISLGQFENELDAAIAFNFKAKELLGNLTVLNEIYGWEKINVYLNRNALNRRINPNKTSKYFGVSFVKDNNNFCAHIGFKGKTYRLGVFDDETGAALAYNQKAIELCGKDAILNEIDYWEELNCVLKKKLKDGRPKKYEGIFYNKEKNKWAVIITKNKERKYFGCYKSEIVAALIYNIEAKKIFEDNAKQNIVLIKECVNGSNVIQ